ncbi:MAG: FkbM family methyltransferase [Gemmataceae bacterium]|nr:FkbM family methyltransferase [Gemmataceae bacterium]MDW8267254.1 FkbM family methyltransferase [Gemmataceae bacterium]
MFPDKVPMVSYAQNREDVLLHRVFADQREGFYVDVGAHHPTFGSVTRTFYDRGWRGINIEPGPIFAKLAAARPRDINLNVAVSDTAGTILYSEGPLYSGLSHVGPGTTPGEVTRPVTARTLRDIFEEYWPASGVSFMSVDVEGHELQVLRGNDWSRYRPQLVLVEATKPMSPEPSHHAWEPLLLGADYLFACFDGLNRFYVRRENQELAEKLRVPPNVFDHYVLAEMKELGDLLHLQQARIAGLEHELAEARKLVADIGPRALHYGLSLARALTRWKRRARRWLRRAG